MKVKRTLSAAIAGAVVLSTFTVPAVNAADETGSEMPVPVINVNFDEGSDNYTLHGGTLADGRSGKALQLNGSGQYADINGIADKLAAIDGDFTISVWFMPSAITTWTRVFDFGNGSSGTYVFLTPSSGSNPRLAVTTSGNTAEQQVNSDTPLSAGEWYNITITRTGDVSTIYVDGIETGTTTDLKHKFSEIGKMQNYYLGKSQFDTDPYFNGMIDDFLVYDEALSTNDIHTLAAEKFEEKKNQIVFEKNCYTISVSAANSSGSEIFSISDEQKSDNIYVSDKNINGTEARFVLNNASDKDVSGITAYAAVYDENGALTGLSSKALSDEDITSDAQTVSLDLPAAGSASKLFVWDGMQPVSETADSYTFTAHVENNTANSGAVKAAAYAVSNDNTEVLLSSSNEVTVDSVSDRDLCLSVPSSSIPAGTDKVIIKVSVPENGGTEEYTAGTYYCGIVSPVAAPADSSITTDGAHDPSIVKFPNDDNYYVYSSHHLIFTSKDLINWTKYDFTNITVQRLTPVTYNFITTNYPGTAVNDTYWAPDVIYREDDAEHPYWMYISVSCGLGGRNSAISLMKSSSPLFWADPDADIVDAGVVFATKHIDTYVTNAIDANIYTEDDGTQYFIWGSFWGGIQAAKMTDDGFVEGVDYSSDASILSTCANVKHTIYSQKNGIAGPEGAWMIEHGGNRYCFTSYGWLGSNYNTRVARSSTDKTLLDSTLTDANGRDMSTEMGNGSNSMPSGYKLIGSYRLGEGTYTISGNDDDYYIERQPGDAHVYYGPGHNSAITAENGETFYVSHTRKDAVEIAATLQVRKMLWTSDGWPVVSPVTYAGEVEQALPEEMIAGTYDLASVGHTKMEGRSIKSRNFDLPVLSSKVTLNADGTMADGLGTWTFDGDHTVTLTFAKDGDTSKDEFYKTGDVMTLYTLFGYDKDEKEPVIALTGTDQNHITQFAKKSINNIVETKPITIDATESIEIAKSAGGNPELGFDADGNILYGGDPAATVIDDTVYLIVGHDTSTGDSYVMPEWVLYTSKNMTDWEYKGPIMSAKDISWRTNDTSAWASQMVEYNGKYYFYFCTWDKTDSNRQSIGVAVADSPEGPYTDALGKPLISGSFTTPESSNYNDIDPTVLITTDDEGTEHRYLAWGNGKYYICELNEDMTSVKDLDGNDVIEMHKDVLERNIKSMGEGVYTEAPWLYERDGKYYLFFAMNWREEMAYAMSDDPMGRYDYKQTIMPPTATSNTNHPSVIDFNGKTYFIYHNGALPDGSGYRRSVCIQKLEFDENGYVYPLTETSVGLTGTASVIKTKDNKYIGHNEFRNPLSGTSYPISEPLTVVDIENGYNTAWELVDAKYVPDGEDGKYYVSIQSVNKPGLYISSKKGTTVLTQDHDGEQGAKMTFRTTAPINGDETGVSFESVSDPGRYLTVFNGTLTLSYGTIPDDCVFSIDTATAKDESIIDVADVVPEPEPEADISQNFDSAAQGTLISLQTSDTPAYTALDGVTLYIGTRKDGPDYDQKFAIVSGGITGNALGLYAGKYQTVSRGPRLQINTPAIPNGYTVTASIMVKQGVNGSVLRYNDSTYDETGVNIEGISTNWKELKISITNNNYTFTRIITFDGELLKQDYLNLFPVLWGTVVNETGQSILFDDLKITTVDSNGETPELPEVTLPDPAAEFLFDGDLTDNVSGESASVTGSKISETVTEPAAPIFTEGADGGQAITFSGEGSYGLVLPAKPAGSEYTISFDAKLNASTKFTPFVFLGNYNGDVFMGGTDAQWVSISAQGWQENLNNGPMVWSINLPEGQNYTDLVPSATGTLDLNEWHNVTVSARGTTASIYVDNVKVGEGPVTDIVNDTTKVFVGINDWDTPLNGAIDNLRIYNEALTFAQIALQ